VTRTAFNSALALPTIRSTCALARVLALVLAISGAGSAGADPHVASYYQSTVFETTPILRPNVRLRVRIYGEYDSNTQLFYDRKALDLLLGTLDLRRLRGDPKPAVHRERRRLAGALARLANGKRTRLSPTEARLLALYRGRESLLAGAARRIGTRTGWKNHFAKGLRRMARYRPYVEEVLLRNGVSTELVALAMTESLFNTEATSWAKAHGVWQFLAKTGVKYLHINQVVDERRDPIISTDAAARMLLEMKGFLKEWPLVITAYNCGPDRMLRAAKAVKSFDLGVVVRDWKPGRWMGNSRNYYASFLASLHVLKNLPRYFPDLELPEPLRFDNIALDAPARLSAVARRCDVPRKTLLALNPAFTKAAARSRLALPEGFVLRVPRGKAARCGGAATKLAARRGPAFSVVPVAEP